MPPPDPDAHGSPTGTDVDVESQPHPHLRDGHGKTTATPTAKGSPSTPGTAPASEAWTSYTAADGQLMFEHPAAWSVGDPAGELPEGGGAFAEVTNEAGRPLATLRTNMTVGSTCMDRYPYAVLDSQELPDLMQGEGAPRFIYETRGNDATPGPADTPPTAAMFGAYYNSENNVTPGAASLPYLEQAKKYMETDEYQDIRRIDHVAAAGGLICRRVPPMPGHPSRQC